MERILVVDDEPDIANMLRMGLGQSGYSVDVFGDPVEALAKFRPGKYDLVISDMKLPNMNGLEMVFEMEKMDSRVQFLFLTGYVDLYAETRKLFSKMNVRAVLQKPIGIRELTTKIDELKRPRETRVTRYGSEKAQLPLTVPPREELTKLILEEANLESTLGHIAQEMRPKLEFRWPEFVDAVSYLVGKGLLHARGNGFEVLYSRTEEAEKKGQRVR